MVAGAASCQCGAVCEGLYPGATVWAAGPRTVTASRPPKTSVSLVPVPAPNAASAPNGAPAGAREDGEGENRDLRALRIEVQRLGIKVDQLRQEGQLQRDIVASMAQLRDELRPAGGGAPASAAPVSVTNLDTRFRWLVDEISQRFVILGSNLARIDRELTQQRNRHGTNTAGARVANGSNGSNGNRCVSDRPTGVPDRPKR